jgi:hypothetical protein
MADNHEIAENTASAGPGTPANLSSSRGILLPRIAISVVIGVLLILVIFLYQQSRTRAEKLAEETRAREKADLRVSQTEESLAQKLSRINQLENKLTESDQQRLKLAESFSRLDKAHAQMAEQLKASQTEEKMLRDRLREELQSLSEARKKNDEERKTEKMLFSKIEKLMDERVSLKEKLAQLQASAPASVEIPQLVVSEEKQYSAALRGTILAVNRHYNFVVFNLGAKDGVKVGDKFFIFDYNRKVGEALVRRVLPGMTVAGIKQSTGGIRKNFTVILHD